jgi:hypothetical protein
MSNIKMFIITEDITPYILLASSNTLHYKQEMKQNITNKCNKEKNINILCITSHKQHHLDFHLYNIYSVSS